MALHKRVLALCVIASGLGLIVRSFWPTPAFVPSVRLPDGRGVNTTHYLSTNQCAVIPDVKGLVKILPIEYLKAYADAGLVTLPSSE
jgi:hypothetical protein